ncbi:MAG: general secretion pathway protein H [Gammaproteobacteria bacterium]|jgi:general secretion pathway protein H
MLGTGISTVKQKGYLERGFTLFELLIVVAIIGISVNIILISSSLVKGSDSLKQVAQNLEKVVKLLRQEAVFENRNYAISLHHKGYNILEFNGEDWQIVDESFFRKYKLPEDFYSRLAVEGVKITTVDIETAKPHILILASGEMSNFEWIIEDEKSKSFIKLEGNLLGQIEFSKPLPLS